MFSSSDAIFIRREGLETWSEGVGGLSHWSGMIADHRKNLGDVAKIERFSILRIRPRLFQIIGAVYDLQFSLVGKIWDGRETAKSPIVWDFSDI